jgi:hypothetical protein
MIKTCSESKSSLNGDIHISLRDDIKSGSAFIRTRHHNLRCFPQCSPVHKASAFCGCPLYATVTVNDVSKVDAHALYGIFHNEMQTVPTSIGCKLDIQAVAEQVGNPMMQARLYKTEGNQESYIFMPDGKWEFPANLAADSSEYYFSVFFVIDGVLRQIARSKSFSILPTWKAHMIVNGPSNRSSSVSPSCENHVDHKLEKSPKGNECCEAGNRCSSKQTHMSKKRATPGQEKYQDVFTSCSKRVLLAVEQPNTGNYVQAEATKSDMQANLHITATPLYNAMSAMVKLAIPNNRSYPLRTPYPVTIPRFLNGSFLSQGLSQGRFIPLDVPILPSMPFPVNRFLPQARVIQMAPVFPGSLSGGRPVTSARSYDI